MIYDIGLSVTCTYDRSAVGGRHLLHLMPADLPGVQHRLRGILRIDPSPSERRDVIDFFRNAGTEVVFRQAHREIVFRIEARVERIAEPPSLDISPTLGRLGDEISGYRGLDPEAPHHFTGASPRIASSKEMSAFAWEQVGADTTAFQAVRAIGEALHREMRYDPEATNVATPPAEAFARRHGVCQDFAQVMIGCLRGIGVPAGYVSGFLRTTPPPGRPRLEGADAMHAWVRAWCGWESGWIEYDPTNALIVGTDHVVIARGRDYGDVAPVSGVLRISGEQSTDQAVDVVPVPEAV